MSSEVRWSQAPPPCLAPRGSADPCRSHCCCSATPSPADFHEIRNLLTGCVNCSVRSNEPACGCPANDPLTDTRAARPSSRGSASRPSATMVSPSTASVLVAEQTNILLLSRDGHVHEGESSFTSTATFGYFSSILTLRPGSRQRMHPMSLAFLLPPSLARPPD